MACKNLNLKKPLFVTDDQLVNKKIVKDTLINLKNENVTVEVYSNVKGNQQAQMYTKVLYFIKKKNVME